jgi:hypothetical protein
VGTVEVAANLRNVESGICKIHLLNYHRKDLIHSFSAAEMTNSCVVQQLYTTAFDRTRAGIVLSEVGSTVLASLLYAWRAGRTRGSHDSVQGKIQHLNYII